MSGGSTWGNVCSLEIPDESCPEELPNHGSLSIMPQLRAANDPENGDEIPDDFLLHFCCSILPPAELLKQS